MELLNESVPNPLAKTPKSGMSTGGKILIAATGGVGIGLSIVCASFVAPAFRRICLPYVPATTEQIQNVLSFLPKNSAGKLLDIGSGDGRIVVGKYASPSPFKNIADNLCNSFQLRHSIVVL